ncbi:PH domain-containing protein [Sphingosinicella sp.]|uniref:PH domain-containing protein n=1 Tax=Sphingosinicella sp. TaxID=1917971 RepID=UPI00403777A5
MDAEPAMTPLDPRQIKVLRARASIATLALTGIAVAICLGPLRATPIPFGVLPGSVAILGLLAALILPRRRYRAWGYREEEDELHVRHGLLIRVQTAVPFARVQHIDLAQGPIERRYGLARLILHTAGTRGASIPLPGLAREEAEAMRDRIRAKIREDFG